MLQILVVMWHVKADKYLDCKFLFLSWIGAFQWNRQDYIIIRFQGTPTKGETPSKPEKKVDDKENIQQAEEAGASCLVNETFKLEPDNLTTFKELSDQSATAATAAGDTETEAMLGPDKYSSIAVLDEEAEDEKWEERTAVITKNDHEEYVSAAGAILRDILADVKTPIKRCVYLHVILLTEFPTQFRFYILF